MPNELYLDRSIEVERRLTDFLQSLASFHANLQLDREISHEVLSKLPNLLTEENEVVFNIPNAELVIPSVPNLLRQMNVTRLDQLEDNSVIVDGEIVNLEERTTTLEGRATTLEGRATTLEGRATTLEGQATTLEGQATTLEGQATTLEGRATTLEGRTTTLEGRATTLEGRATTLEGRATTLENSQANSSIPIGTVVTYAGSTEPNGWIFCDGRELNRSTYSVLFQKLGTVYGSGNGTTTFNVPDTRGIFIKGAGTTTRTAGKTSNGNFYAGTLGNYETDQMQGHRHSAVQYNNGQLLLSSGANQVIWGTSLIANTAEQTGSFGCGNPLSDTNNGTPRLGNSTHPANISMNNIIYTGVFS